MSLDVSLRFYNSHNIGKRGSIEQVVDLFKSEKFRLYDINVQGGNRESFHWDTYGPNEKNILATAYQYNGINFKCAKDEELIELIVFIGWTITNTIQPSDTFLGITTFQTALFTREENNPIFYSNFLLNIGRLLFQVSNPDFGWIDMENFAGSTLDEDVSSVLTPYTYWANFLGQSYTRKYGTDKLLSAPVWHTETLIPEGVLLVLSPVLGFHTGDTELLKNYLG